MTTQNISKMELDPRAVAEIDQKIHTDSQNGIVGSWWQLGIGMTEASCTTAYGLAQDVRSEARRRADAVLGFAEEMATGTFEFARKVVDRVDRVTKEGLGRSEAAMLVVTRTLRKTGHGVTDLASTALSDTIGSAPAARRPMDGARATA
ncbi:MAG TPA: hypothetical protein VHE30_03505 [Polyangiaceae bacterium]|nr:hypothetical protein [Polyangiaceae bacterium]